VTLRASRGQGKPCPYENNNTRGDKPQNFAKSANLCTTKAKLLA